MTVPKGRLQICRKFCQVSASCHINAMTPNSTADAPKTIRPYNGVFMEKRRAALGSRKHPNSLRKLRAIIQLIRKLQREVAWILAARSSMRGCTTVLGHSLIARAFGWYDSSMVFHVKLSKTEDGWIVVECPALPGCVSQGKDEQEALANIKEEPEILVTV